jgi:hypothetical protein
MKQKKHLQSLLPATLLLISLCLPAPGYGEQILATVGREPITDTQLSLAMESAPFASRIPSMDEDQQAQVRGNMLVRLVDAELLRLEALATGVDQATDFKHELVNYRTSLLYRKYIQALRDSIVIPDEADASMKQRYRGNPDALAAARSTYVSRRFKPLKVTRFNELRKRYEVAVYPDRLETGPADNTIVATGSFFTLRYADVKLPASARAPADRPAQERDRLARLVEMMLAAQAARDSAVTVEDEVAAYRDEILPQALIQKKEREWVPDEAALRDYYQTHPQLANVPERRHIAQLVLATCDEAQSMRRRILAGASLFELASEYSTDPYGRTHAGDMGWLAAGSGYPALEEALKGLEDGKISEPVRTPRGCHIVMIQERQPSRQRGFADIHDEVRQALISEHAADYLRQLAIKYPVKWNLPVRPDRQTAAEPATTPR